MQVEQSSEVPVHVTCAICAGNLPHGGPVTEGFPLLKDPSELEAHGHAHKTDTDSTHAVAEHGVLAEYLFASKWTCSLPDRTPHNHGFLIRTVCGMVLTIGKDCGQKHLRGLRAGVARAQNERTRAEVEKSLSRTSGMVAKINALEPRFERAFGALGKVKRWIPELHAHIHKDEAFFNASRGLFSADGIERCQSELGLLAKIKIVALAEAQNVRNRLKAATDQQEDLLKGLAEVERLFTEDGMTTAVRKLEKEGKWFARGRGIEFTADGKKLRLDLEDGLTDAYPPKE